MQYAIVSAALFGAAMAAYAPQGPPPSQQYGASSEAAWTPESSAAAETPATYAAPPAYGASSPVWTSSAAAETPYKSAPAYGWSSESWAASSSAAPEHPHPYSGKPETQTVWHSEYYTVTSCGPEVTNCPAGPKPTGSWGAGSWGSSAESWGSSAEAIKPSSSWAEGYSHPGAAAPTGGWAGSKTTSGWAAQGTGSWSPTGTGAGWSNGASNVQAAGMLIGAGAVAALFL